MREKRVSRVRAIVEDMGMDGCVLRGPDNVFYLTGFRGSEGTLLVTGRSLFLITDFRYVTYAREATEGVEIVELKDRKNPLAELCNDLAVKRLGFDGTHTPFSLYERWKETMKDVELLPLREEIEEIRRCKEAGEIGTIRKAVAIATRAMEDTLKALRPGMRERDVCNELEYRLKGLGAEGPSFPTIVAAGPRAALPHAEPSDRIIGEGETVIMDFGAKVDGYCSDETCTVVLGDVPGEILRIHGVVNDARKRGVEAVRPGLKAKEIDAIVRGIIEEAGYGRFFGHGTGHGVGIAVHEAPSVNSSGEMVLEENMVLTVEPGIYIPDVGGVRLEDLVLVTADGGEILTGIPKDMIRRH